LKRPSIRTPYHCLERNVIESWKPGESLSFGRWRWIQAAQSRPPSISAASDYRPGYDKNPTPMATLASANAPSSLAQRLAAGHADRTRTTRMSGASGGVIAFWPRARPSGSAEADRLLRQVTEGSEDHRSDASARTGRGR